MAHLIRKKDPGWQIFYSDPGLDHFLLVGKCRVSRGRQLRVPLLLPLTPQGREEERRQEPSHRDFVVSEQVDPDPSERLQCHSLEDLEDTFGGAARVVLGQGQVRPREVLVRHDAKELDHCFSLHENAMTHERYMGSGGSCALRNVRYTHCEGVRIDDAIQYVQMPLLYSSGSRKK